MRSMTLCVALLLAGIALAPANAAPDRTARARNIIDNLQNGRYAAVVATFDETVRAALPAERAQELWRTLLQQAGPLVKVEGTRAARVGKYDVVYVVCRFERALLDVEIAFDAAGKVSGLHFLPSQGIPPRPPAAPAAKPKAPSAASAPALEGGPGTLDVTVGMGEWKLPGTVTLPEGRGPFPGVVLVHGSGPSDRDETLGPNKPFRDLALGLARRGVAVLRYEKRTKEHAARMAALGDKITVREEVLDDALAAVARLRQVPSVNPARVFVLGHSLGGMLAPRLGALDPKLAGLILLAAPTRPLEDLIVAQTTYLAALDGSVSAEEQKTLDDLKAKVARVKDPGLSPATPAADLPLGVPAPYWIHLRRYSPAEAARQAKQPLLILQGERDYQVTMEDFAAWKQALAGRPNVTLKSYPALNHLFMPGEGKSTPTEYATEGHVSTEVIQEIAGWINGRAKR